MPSPQPVRFAQRIKLKTSSVRTRMLDIAANLTDVIALGRGDPDLDTPPHVVEAGRKALAEGATHYTHPMGLPELRRSIAQSIAAHGGATYAPDEIVVTAGAQEGVFAAMLAFVEAGDEVLIPSPGYNTYHQAVELAGGTVVTVPTYQENDFALTASAVRERITPRTRMLCLINPSNPTGTVIGEDDVRALAALAVEHDLIVISDEIYARIVAPGVRVQPVAALPGLRERTITIDGFSKAYSMTGWRVGYFAGPASLVPAMAEIHHGLAICAPAVSQHAALAALTGSQDCIAEACRTYDERRTAMCAALDGMGLTYAKPSGAFYVYANVSSTGLSASDFCIRLLQDGRVMIFPGSLFGDHRDDFVRISLLQPLPRIAEAVRRMGEVVAAIRSETSAHASQETRP